MFLEAIIYVSLTRMRDGICLGMHRVKQALDFNRFQQGAIIVEEDINMYWYISTHEADRNREFCEQKYENHRPDH